MFYERSKAPVADKKNSIPFQTIKKNQDGF